MPRQKLNNQNNLRHVAKEGYIIIPNYFLREWIKVLGIGPALLYLQLLSYCHKEKGIAWPTINSLCQQMKIAKTTLLRCQNTLIKFGLIKNITKNKSTTGHYRNNVYQVTPLEKIPGHWDIRYQNNTYNGSNLKLSLVSKRYPNNTNLNNTNTTTTNRENVVVDFKKLKEKGEERIRAVRERMVELDFKEEFIERILKDYSAKKIDEKLALLMDKRNIQNPAGWLKSALKNDYRDEEQESQPISHPHLNPPPSTSTSLSPRRERVRMRGNSL